ncbi:MAG: 30S ribosomal protein S27ae [Thermoplasmata archaeon]|nr:30S ribosomal protein S27ae [Thermoplasmata archaeon]
MTEEEKSKRHLYEIKDEKLVRLRDECPKCGPGVFMAKHKDRVSCGRCGYTEFSK